MSDSHRHELPQVQAANNEKLGEHHFLIPSPIPTRRNRTQSMSERALQGPTFRGTVKSFCRQRGHGFLQPDDGSQVLFVHISDIEGEYVPKEGDEVTYKTFLIPPRNEKEQAVHVKITHLAPGVSHERWDSGLSNPQTSPNISPRS